MVAWAQGAGEGRGQEGETEACCAGERVSLLSPPETRPVLCLSPGCGRRKQRLEKMRLLDSGLLENVREDPRLAMVSPDTRQHMV